MAEEDDLKEVVSENTSSKDISLLRIRKEREAIENDKLRNDWVIAGAHFNQAAIKFSVQVSFSFIVLLFAIVQIARGATNTDIYFSLISGIIGYFMPNPSLD